VLEKLPVPLRQALNNWRVIPGELAVASATRNPGISIHHSVTPSLQLFYVAPSESILIRLSSHLATPTGFLMSRHNFTSTEFL